MSARQGRQVAGTGESAQRGTRSLRKGSDMANADYLAVAAPAAVPILAFLIAHLAPIDGGEYAALARMGYYAIAAVVTAITWLASPALARFGVAMNALQPWGC